MGNVVSLRRNQNDLKKKAIEELEKDDNQYQMYISFSEEDAEEGTICFYTNFNAGTREITALQVLLTFIAEQQFEVVEE